MLLPSANVFNTYVYLLLILMFIHGLRPVQMNFRSKALVNSHNIKHLSNICQTSQIHLKYISNTSKIRERSLVIAA